MNQNMTKQIYQSERSFTDILRVSENEFVQKRLLVGPSAHSLDTNVPFLPSARFAGVAMVCRLCFSALKAALYMFSLCACWQFSLIVYSALIFTLSLKDLCVC